MKLRLLAATLAATPLVAASFQELTNAQDAEPKKPEVGAAAPSFRLNDQHGKSLSVGGESEHWTVVAFYPKAMTPG